MPTFTAIALDRVLELPQSMAPSKNGPDSRLERRNTTPSSALERGISIPPRLEKKSSLPRSKSERKNVPSAIAVDRNNHWTQISPALYATPKPIPISDTPSSYSTSSYPPSPYVINHKRRGPNLVKSFSEANVANNKPAVDEQTDDENAKDTEKKSSSMDDNHFPPAVCSPDMGANENGIIHCVKEEHENGKFSPVKEHANGSCTPERKEDVNGTCSGETQGCEMSNGSAGKNEIKKSVFFNLQKTSEFDDFVDHLDSLSVKSNIEGDTNSGLERSLNTLTPMAEFYDAWEDLSSEIAPQPPVPDIEAELREIRLSILMEIEKRKQAEEALNNMQNEWQRIRSQLSSVGLTLPADPLVVTENDPVEELSQQVYLARCVSNSIGRATAKAEVEMEMEAQLEVKNFEIARLLDRLHYYEAVNREMSQRNQEAVDTARRLRQTRKKRQKWVWGSIAAAITLGSAVLAWSYQSTGKGTSSSSHSHASEGDHTSKN